MIKLIILMILTGSPARWMEYRASVIYNTMHDCLIAGIELAEDMQNKALYPVVKTEINCINFQYLKDEDLKHY